MKITVIMEYEGEDEFVTETSWGEDPDKAFSRKAWNEIHDLLKNNTIHDYGGWTAVTKPKE